MLNSPASIGHWSVAATTSFLCIAGKNTPRVLANSIVQAYMANIFHEYQSKNVTKRERNFSVCSSAASLDHWFAPSVMEEGKSALVPIKIIIKCIVQHGLLDGCCIRHPHPPPFKMILYIAPSLCLPASDLSTLCECNDVAGWRSEKQIENHSVYTACMFPRYSPP